MAVSLYVHIPFCWRICPYCAFFKMPWSAEKEAPFLAALAQECQFYAEQWPDLEIATLYLGGGTPSILTDATLEKMMALFNARWTIPDSAEKTIEMNPESITYERVQRLQQLGFNRLSIGIQSVLRSELQFLGRPALQPRFKSAIQALPQWGVPNFNLDLIFGLPNQSVSKLDHSLNWVLEMNPSHITTYGLTIEPSTPFFDNQIQAADSDTQHQAYSHIRAHLQANGFDHYEVSSFAKPGFGGQHNLRYWSFKDYIGLGPGAHSFFKNRRYSQPRDWNQYVTHPTHSITLAMSEQAAPPSDLLKDFLIFQLRQIKPLRFASINSTFNIQFETQYKPILETLAAQDLITYDTVQFSVTDRGLNLLDTVLESFL